MRGQELVGLVFHTASVGGEFRQLIGSRCESLVEGLLDLLGEADVLGFVDADAGVAVGDELFGDRNGDCSTSASGLTRAAAAARVVGILDALLVRGQVELQP